VLCLCLPRTMPSRPDFGSMPRHSRAAKRLCKHSVQISEVAPMPPTLAGGGRGGVLIARVSSPWGVSVWVVPGYGGEGYPLPSPAMGEGGSPLPISILIHTDPGGRRSFDMCIIGLMCALRVSHSMLGTVLMLLSSQSLAQTCHPSCSHHGPVCCCEGWGLEGLAMLYLGSGCHIVSTGGTFVHVVATALCVCCLLACTLLNCYWVWNHTRVKHHDGSLLGL
jgi:hypothetical protein